MRGVCVCVCVCVYVCVCVRARVCVGVNNHSRATDGGGRRAQMRVGAGHGGGGIRETASCNRYGMEDTERTSCVKQVTELEKPWKYFRFALVHGG